MPTVFFLERIGKIRLIPKARILFRTHGTWTRTVDDSVPELLQFSAHSEIEQSIIGLGKGRLVHLLPRARRIGQTVDFNPELFAYDVNSQFKGFMLTTPSRLAGWSERFES